MEIIQMLVKFILLSTLIFFCVPFVLLIDRKIFALNSGFFISSGHEFKKLFFQVFKVFDKREKAGRLSELVYLFAVPLLATIPIMTIPLVDDFFIYDKKLSFHLIDSPHGIIISFLIFFISNTFRYLFNKNSFDSNTAFLSSRSTLIQLSCYVVMGISIFSCVLFYNSSSYDQIIQFQNQELAYGLNKWGVLVQPLSMLLFVVAVFYLIRSQAEKVILWNNYNNESNTLATYLRRYTYVSDLVFYSLLFVMLFLNGYSVIPGIAGMFDVPQVLLIFLQGLSLLIKAALCLFGFLWLDRAIGNVEPKVVLNKLSYIVLPLAILNLMITSLLKGFFG